ncbi:hypothetical protein F3Y22_tig00110327pilonHSYRG00060 [Hibiscus syriacus]|uniref:Uncharacterized protein n=1 Tax=Hibiscus syriacus TaxID=106335 RepID=A0A6A3AZK2_HIBSY|nr:hypothetical protein F3Y22_tig00110327pilonHSYRG00060 [Hibiscus syriacus]
MPSNLNPNPIGVETGIPRTTYPKLSEYSSSLPWFGSALVVNIPSKAQKMIPIHSLIILTKITWMACDIVPSRGFCICSIYFIPDPLRVSLNHDLASFFSDLTAILTASASLIFVEDLDIFMTRPLRFQPRLDPIIVHQVPQFVIVITFVEENITLKKEPRSWFNEKRSG